MRGPSRLLAWLFLAVTFRKTTASLFRRPRIVGGGDAQPGQYPFFVSWAGSCGGTLVAPNLVLTAAHCGIIESNVVVISAFWYGSAEGATVGTITERLFHPQYDGNVKNDFLLLRLSEPVEIAPLPFDDSVESLDQGEHLTVIGLGRTEENGSIAATLQEAKVPVRDSSHCEAVFGSSFESQLMFCAGGATIDSCHGDSGGPAMSSNGLLGVISYGIGCGREGFPGVYAKVSSAREWIDSTICAVSTKAPDTCKSRVLIIELQLDGYPRETSWSLRASLDSTVLTAGSSYAIPNTKYYEVVELTPGTDYVFEIIDEFADGICCEYGNGYYRLLLEGREIGVGTDFGQHSIVSFRFNGAAASNAESSFPSSSPSRSPSILPTPIPSASTVAPTRRPSVVPSVAPSHHPTKMSSDPSSYPEMIIPKDANDSCIDTDVHFHVDNTIGIQNCVWLSDNSVRYEFLCQFVDVAVACPFTCDLCDLFM